MELMPGYKQTEVGVIPRAWDVVTVKQLVEEEALEKPLDGNHGNIHPKSSDYVDYGIPFVMANNFANGEVSLESCKFITKERADKLQKGFSVTGDVLLTHKGTVGSTAIVGALSTDYIMLTPQVTYYRVKDPNRLSNFYLRQYFDSSRFQSLFASLAGGGTRAYLGIVKQLELPIVRPPLPEQRAIATVLSDVDALLGGLDRLIAKKRDLKQAAMQQLLMGKTRLPGFNGEWEEKALGEIAIISKGVQLHSSETNPDGHIPHYNGGMQPSSLTVRFNTPANTIAISEGGNSCGFVQFITEPFWCGGHCYAVVPKSVDNGFLFHALKGQQSAIMGLRVGSGLPNVQKTALGLFKLKFPKNPIEQTAIADVLSDMDAELSDLENRLKKTRFLKQAMMQELLTGKTRLVEP